MASKRKRGEAWEYFVKKKGVLPKTLTLTFGSEAEGDEYVAQLEKLLAAGIVPAEFQAKATAILTVGRAIEQYCRAVHITDDDVGILGALAHSVGAVRICEVNYAWAERWVASLRNAGSSPSTIRHKVGALARCLDWLVRRADTMLSANPLRILPKRYATTADGRKDVERDRRLLPGEEARILQVLSGERIDGRQRPIAAESCESLRLMFVLALETAMRLREIYTLTGEQVDIAQRTIFLDKTKNGDSRQVPLSSVAVAELDGLAGGLLFPLWWQGSVDAAALRKASNRLSSQWSRVFDAAQCEGLHFHDLRHEATSRLYERTSLSDVQISRITGHRSLQMLRRYSNLRGSDLASRLW